MLSKHCPAAYMRGGASAVDRPTKPFTIYPIYLKFTGDFSAFLYGIRP